MLTTSGAIQVCSVPALAAATEKAVAKWNTALMTEVGRNILLWDSSGIENYSEINAE